MVCLKTAEEPVWPVNAVMKARFLVIILNMVLLSRYRESFNKIVVLGSVIIRNYNKAV